MRPSPNALLSPRSVAVFGASPRRRMASTVVANLRRYGFPGAIYPIHPSEEPVEGLRCYPSLSVLHEVPDCAVIALSPTNTLEVMRQAAALGVRAAVLLGSGFGEADEAGRRIQAAIVALASEANMALCGPNCLGLIAPAGGVALTGYHLPDNLAAGNVAAVAQSGSVFFSLAHNRRGIRFNRLISSGNEAQLTAADYLDAALDDPTTRVLVAFLESVRDGERFLSLAARARERAAPLVVLKVGRSEAAQRSVVAHTGALAGSDAIFDAVCRQEGIIRVETLDELYDVVELLLAGRLPAGRNVAVITDSGGEKTLILDWGERVGLNFPGLSEETQAGLRGLLAPYVPVANPLDAWGAGNYEEIYPAALRMLATDPQVDVVVLGTDMVHETEEAELYGRAVLDAHAATEKPVVVVTNQANAVDQSVADRLRKAGVPVLHGTEYGYHAIRRVADYAAALTQERRTAPSASADEVAWLEWELASAPGVIGDAHALELLSRFGLPVVRGEPVEDLPAALTAAARIGYPVALKGQAVAGLAHKSDAGAIELGIAGPAALEAAWAAIEERVARQAPALDLSGMLVQEMVSPGLELLIGMSVDPTFGPMLAVGLGGVFVELLDDVAYARPPLDLAGAEELLRSLRGSRLFVGYRGTPPRDLRATAEAIVALSRFVIAAGSQIVEIDINPLIVLAEGAGARAVDALIVQLE